MSLRDTVHDWLDSGFTPKAKNPTLSKRLVIKNLEQIKELLNEDSAFIAIERINILIEEIKSDKLKPGTL